MLPFSAEVGWWHGRAVGFLLRPGFLHSDSGADAVTRGDARFILNEGSLDLCAAIPAAASLTLLPCAHAEGGELSAAGSNVLPARSEDRPWLGVGAAFVVRYVLFSPVFLELSGGVRFPLVRDRFFFEPDTTVFKPPVIGGFGAGSVGVAFL